MNRIEYARLAQALKSTVTIAASIYILASCSRGGDAVGGQDSAVQAEKPSQSVVIINTQSPPQFHADDPTVRRIVFTPDGVGMERPAAQLAQAMKDAVADPGVAAIVVFPAIKGSAAEFAKARSARPGLLLFAVEPEDDILEIEEAATLVVSGDQAANAYGAVWAAARLGCTSITYVSSKAPEADSQAESRRAVIEQAAKEFKLLVHEARLVSKFGKPEAAKPAAADGQVPAFADAAELVMKVAADEAKSAGPRVKAAWYLADGAVIPGMLPAVLAIGGVVSGVYPVSFLPYYPAFAELPVTTQSPGEALAEFEKFIAAKGGAGRFILQGYPEDSAVEAALMLCIQDMLKRSPSKVPDAVPKVPDAVPKVPDAASFLAFLGQATPGIAWRADYAVDKLTGVRSRNHLLVFQDMYLLGRGYLPFTKGSIPESYRR